MGDLKPLWGDVPVPTPDLGGDLATTRGTDPLIDTGGSSGLTASPWSGAKQPYTETPTEESSNSVSSLPMRPNRFSPSPAEPPGPPTLTDRNPGTIDQK